MTVSLKNLIFIQFALITLLCSCTGDRTANTNSLLFAKLELDSTYYLLNESHNPSCTFNAVLEYPIEGSDSAQFLIAKNKFIYENFGEKYLHQSIPDAAYLFMIDYIENYKMFESDFKELKQERLNEYYSMGSWNFEFVSKTKTIYNEHDFYCFGITRYNYTGGAHGIETEYYFTENIGLNETVTLVDLFSIDDIDQIKDLLLLVIAKNNGFKNIDDLAASEYWIENIELGDNFYIDYNGITWIYNPYEIAPFTVGITRATLSWKKLMPFIDESSIIYNLAKSYTN